MQWYIDTREEALITYLNKVSVSFERKALDVGDIQAWFNDCPVLCIERKSLPDLSSSISDGRYREQKIRLQQFRQNHPSVQVFYVLEQESKSRVDSLRKDPAIMGSIVNTLIRDRMPVFKTVDVSDTADFIIEMMIRMNRDPHKYTNGANAATTPNKENKDNHTDALIKCQRKGNIDMDTCFLMQLSCIPGISHKKAVAIRDHYHVQNMKDLCARLMESACPIKHLQEVDGIGKTLAKHVAQHLGVLQMQENR